MNWVLDRALRLVTAVALVISGVIHLQLAKDYPAGLWFTQETAFRVQAIVVFVLAAAVLVAPATRGLIWLATIMVAGGSVTALLLSRYAHVQGYLPGLINEPDWFYKKEVVLVVELVAVVISLVALGFRLRTHATRRVPAHAH